MKTLLTTALLLISFASPAAWARQKPPASAQAKDSDCVSGRITVAGGNTSLLHCLKIRTQARAGWRYTGKLPQGETRIGVRKKEAPYTAYFFDFSTLRSLDLTSSYDLTVVQISGDTVRGFWEGYFGGPGSTTKKLGDVPAGAATSPHWQAFEYFVTGMDDEDKAVRIPWESIRHIDFVQKGSKR
jgi:hypothetical protein